MKKFISLFVTLLLLVNTIYIPTFAASSSSEDIIEYTVPTEVLFEDDFEVEDSDIGENVPGFSHIAAWGTDSKPNAAYPNYASFTYEYGVGGMNGNVGKLYDRAHSENVTRYNTDGTPDTNASRQSARNTDTLAIQSVISGLKRVTTKFKYYHAEGAKASGTEVATLSLMYAQSDGSRSSFSPGFTLYADRAELPCVTDDTAKQNGLGGSTRVISDLETNTWYDVEFEVFYDDANAMAKTTLKIGDQKVESYVSRASRPSYNPNGYDPPAHVSFYFDQKYGGLVYIDDLQILKKAVASENFTFAVEEFTFNEVVSGQTNNVKDNVYDAWPNGLITTYQRGADSYEVQWTSSNPDVISHDGKVVNRKSYTQKVDLTAKIIDSVDVYATRTFKDVVVAPIEGASIETILNEYAQDNIKEELFSKEATSASNRITKDLSPLPTRDDIANIDIEWSASPAGYIDVATGEITRPSFSAQDVEVTLTASLSRDGSEPVTKSIKYTVAKNSDPNLVLDGVVDALVITNEDFSKITQSINLPTEFNDVSITWDTTGHSQIAENGVVTRGDTEVTGTIVATFSFDGATRTKSYELTVYPTALKMLEADVNIIDKTGWDAIVTDFQVPLVGEKYSSILSWTSNSDYVQVKENGYISVKRPPNSYGSDLNVTLLVNAKIGRDEIDIPINITVLRQANDSVAAQEAADSINFDLIRGTNTDQLAVVSNLPLPTGFDYDKGLVVEWTSNKEDVVKKNGEVIRPLPGEEDIEVTLTAVVKKNYSSSTPVTVSFKVKALSNVDELLQEAKDALTFSSISAESIDNVTENLTLPSAGKYGTEIIWESNSSNITVSGTEGIVTCPEWGQSDARVILKANIKYGDLTTQKSFSITIPVSDTYVASSVELNENFNTWTSEYQFNESTPTGSWSIPDIATSGSKADVIDNIGGVSNTAIYLTKEDNAASGYMTYTSYESIKSSSVNVGMKFYVADDFTGTSTVEIFTKGSNFSVAIAYINGADSSIDVVTANGKTLKLANGTFLKNSWNDLKFDVNTEIKKFHVYLNGELVSANGYVTDKETGASFVSVNGIPYSNSNAGSVDGIKWLIDGSVGDTIYLDDLFINTYSVHTEDQKKAAELWEQDLFSRVNINRIEQAFEMPKLKIEGMTITVTSGNTYILDTEGSKVVYRHTILEPTNVTFTVAFDNGINIYRKSYVFTAYPQKVVVTTVPDETAAATDLKNVVDYLSNNYILDNLKTDINFSGIETTYNSKITYSSSDQGVISNEGKITMANSIKTASLTIIAQKGSATKSQTLEITVAKKSPLGNGGGSVGGGGGGGKPVYGENTKPQSGIDVGTPEDNNGENENQGSVSNFTDVAKDHWAYDQINYMVENKIMNGVGDGKIEPERTILREEFVKMLVVALGLDLKDAAADFKDVDKNEWYAPYVATIKEKGLILGYEDGTFGIGQNISRQDLAVLIYRSSSLAAEDVKEAFADDVEIADYAKDAVYTLKDLGVINGKGDGEFDPTASATRAETASMLYKAINLGLFD